MTLIVSVEHATEHGAGMPYACRTATYQLILVHTYVTYVADPSSRSIWILVHVSEENGAIQTTWTEDQGTSNPSWPTTYTGLLLM